MAKKKKKKCEWLPKPTKSPMRKTKDLVGGVVQAAVGIQALKVLGNV